MATQEMTTLPQSRTLSPGGNIIDPAAVNSLMQLAKVWVQSGLLPAHIKTPAQALTIGMMGDALGVNYLIALQEMYVVHGRVGTSAKLARALVLRSGQCEYLSLEADATKAVFTVKRKGFPKEHVETVTIEMARKAGWVKGPNWEGIPDVMLGERATMRALRKIFPDIIHGMYAYDELSIPTRASASDPETIEIDHEEIQADLETVPVAPAVEPEPRLGDLPTDVEKKQLETLIKSSFEDGTPIVLPSERRKIAEELARDGSRANYQRTFDSWTAIAQTRIDARPPGGK